MTSGRNARYCNTAFIMLNVMIGAMGIVTEISNGGSSNGGGNGGGGSEGIILIVFVLLMMCL